MAALDEEVVEEGLGVNVAGPLEGDAEDNALKSAC